MKGRESGMPDAGYWQSFFDSQAVLKKLVPLASPGQILEFGSGYGTFTIPLAHLGHHVLGLDIEPDLVAALSDHAQSQGLPGLRVRLQDFVAQGTGEGDASYDHVLLYNILHIEQPVALLQEAWRVLKPMGKASVIHWRSDIPTPRGPSLEIRPTAEQCALWASEAGFTAIKSIALGDSAPYHYGMTLMKPEK